MANAARHISTIFPMDSLACGEFMELRSFRGRQLGPRSFHNAHGELVSAALRASVEGFDVYVGVAPRRCPESTSIISCAHRARGGKDHIAQIGWAFVEVDVGKGYDTVEEILARFDSLLLPPDLVVASGGGAHGYWQLDRPTSDFARVERVTRALARQLGHDPAFDVSRVLRLAGTVNYKYSPPQMATVVRWKPNAVQH